VSGPDLLPLAAAERADLADFLGTLTADQWEADSLCAGWSVREVAAHVISYDDLTFPRVLARLARGGFRLSGANPLGIREYDEMSTGELLADVRAHVHPPGFTATVFGGANALTDALIHHQDVRRSLGLRREVPAERLVPALDFALRARALPSRRHVHDLRLVATDLDWTRGEGPQVSGPAEAVLMAIAGRAPALAELGGPGTDLLRERLAQDRRAGSVS
jgi:uncharacterized protein (TIGR03083 family)